MKILSNNAIIFYNNWLIKLDLINNDMKKIKKIQNDCLLLYTCNNNEQLLEKKYEGWVIEKNNNKYTIYLSDLKMISYIKSDKEIKIYNKLYFKLFLFNQENNLQKKIRLELLA